MIRTLYQPDCPALEANILDRSALVLYFEAPNTVTGEDVLELHVHGGPAIVKAVLNAISQVATSSTVTYAEPGQFTRRAFQHGKLDLTQVEALGDSLAATTEQQRRLAVRGTAGRLSRQYEIWRTQLLNARGELEALIDFSEDQHFDESVPELLSSVADQVEALLSPLNAHVTNAMRGELLRDGIQISLLGAPNAGKSSLLNRIVGREAAIVSQEAGTTRDIVEVGIDVGGYFCRLGDTAGLRRVGNASFDAGKVGAIEQEGMRRAKDRAAESDVVIVVFDFECLGGQTDLKLDLEVCETASRLVAAKDNVLVVLNKIDLLQHQDQLRGAISKVAHSMPGLGEHSIFPVSCSADYGDSHNSIQSFLAGLKAHFKTMTAAITPDDTTEADRSAWQESLGATIRHRVLLEQTIQALQHFQAIAQPALADAPLVQRSDYDDMAIVLAAEHLRDAAECLAKITGRGEAGDVEEVLGVVFEKFCVGK